MNDALVHFTIFVLSLLSQHQMLCLRHVDIPGETNDDRSLEAFAPSITPPVSAVETKETNRTREGKFLLFPVIVVKPDPCTSSGGDIGICVPKGSCPFHGGVPGGACAFLKLGECCVLTTMGGVVKRNNTFWVGVPTAGTHTVTLRPPSSVCQVRVDFVACRLEGPDTSTDATTGQCLAEYLDVNSATQTVPQLCGILDSQHLYVDVEGPRDVVLTMLTTVSRNFKIRLTQIPCKAKEYRAPAGCLQYFLEDTNQVRSFNWQGGVHLANQVYSICVRRNRGRRQITWTASGTFQVTYDSSNPQAFTETTSPINCGFVVPPNSETGDDFVLIPNLDISKGAFFCGSDFVQGGVTTTIGPFHVDVYFDSGETAFETMNGFNRGFQLSYVQT